MIGRKELFRDFFFLFFLVSLFFIFNKGSGFLEGEASFSFFPIVLSLLFFLLFMIFPVKEEELLIALGIFLSLSLAWVFKKTPFSLGGGIWDSWIYHAMTEKFKHFWGNVDFAYKGFHNFYPFYFYYLIGKIAWLADFPVYKLLKYLPIFLATFFPFLIYLSWKPFFSRFSSAGISISIMFGLWYLFIYKPAEFLVLIFIVPWWLFYWEDKRGNPFWGGIIGGLLFATYYFWFFPFFLLIIFDLGKGIFKYRSLKVLWEKERKRLLIFPSFLLVSLPFWGGYLWDILRWGGEFTQNKWFKPWHMNFFFPLQNINLVSILGFTALLYLFVFREERRSFSLFKILVAVYFVFLLGNVGSALGANLLQFKLNDFILLVFLVSLFLWVERYGHIEMFRRGVALFLVILGSLTILSPKNLNLTGSKIVEPKEEFKRLYGKTILAVPFKLLDFVPCYVFANYDPHYSHPSAHLSRRLAFLYLLQFTRHPDFFSYILQHNRFSRVDLVYFDGRGINAMYYQVRYPHIYQLRFLKFHYAFTRAQLKGDKILNDVFKKGDAVVPLKTFLHPPVKLTPLEKFLLSRFSTVKGKNLAPAFSFKAIPVYLLGRYLLFYKEDCDPKKIPPFFRIVLQNEGRLQEKDFSIDKKGILGDICTGVFPLPKGTSVVGIKPIYANKK